MLQGEWLIVLVVGAVFAILGLAAILWDRHETKSYFDAMSTHTDDLREFMEHWPQRPQFGALLIGGWIAVVIGVLLLAASAVIWLVVPPAS